jgi:hypothetical protein
MRARGLSRTVLTSPPKVMGAEASTVTLSLIRLLQKSWAYPATPWLGRDATITQL